MLEGKGLHFGKDAKMIVHPASADHGIVFKRTDVRDEHAYVNASFENVSKTYLRTQLTNSMGVSIITAEHILAAFAGLGIHNALIELNEAEVPIFDGSSRIFVKAGSFVVSPSSVIFCTTRFGFVSCKFVLLNVVPTFMYHQPV